MFNLRKLIYNKYNFLIKILPLNFLIKSSKQRLIRPCYHTVSDHYLPHIASLIKYKNLASFKSDLDFLLRYCKPVDLFDLIKLIKNQTEPAENLFFLSFDDGLKEFYDVISPVLLEKGIPATCFLNSAFIDNKDLFFRYKASILIDLIYKTDRKSNKWKILKSWFLENNMTPEDYKYELLKIRYDEKTRIDELANVMEFNFKDYLEREKPYLSTQQINELIKKGFTFGAHSIDHPEYRYISYDEQLKQTLQSIDVIVSKFKLNYKVFSFPYTDYMVSRQFFTDINKDNSIDFTANGGGIKRDSIPNHVHRLAMDEYELSGGDRIKAGYFYYLIKSLFNKNKIIRE